MQSYLNFNFNFLAKLMRNMSKKGSSCFLRSVARGGWIALRNRIRGNLITADFTDMSMISRGKIIDLAVLGINKL